MIHYIIIAHKSPEYLKKLCNQLTILWWHVVIHVDANNFSKDFLELESDLIHIIKKPIKVRWWWFSIITATIIAMKELLHHVSDWDHIAVLSGQDFPLISQENLSKKLKNHHNNSFIEFRIQPNDNRNILNRLIKYHFHDLEIPTRINSIFEKIIWLFYPVSWLRNQIFTYLAWRITTILLPYKTYIIRKYEFYWWSQRQIVCYKHLKYIVDFCESKEWQKFLRAFSTTAWPDEFFFQTLLLNSPYKKDIINDLRWYIDWKKWPWLPRILDESDYQIMKESDKRFARKFELWVSDSLIKKLIDWFIVDSSNK